jgi:hypothetical protein
MDVVRVKVGEVWHDVAKVGRRACDNPDLQTVDLSLFSGTAYMPSVDNMNGQGDVLIPQARPPNHIEPRGVSIACQQPRVVFNAH